MADLYHHGVKGQKWGVKRKLKKVGPAVSKAATTARAASNELSHPFKSAAAKAEGHSTKTHGDRKKFNANIDKQKEASRVKGHARFKKAAKYAIKSATGVALVSSGIKQDMVMMDLHRKYPDLYQNPLSKYK